MSGRVVHFEIPADDTDRASGFYRSTFGWDLTAMPEMNYTGVTTTPANEQGMPLQPGAINGGMYQRGENLPANPVVTVDVEDIDSTLEKIGTLGGSTVVAKQEIPGMGFFAYFKDTEGNVLGLWQNAE